MTDAAQSLYPNGPSTVLGNKKQREWTDLSPEQQQDLIKGATEQLGGTRHIGDIEQSLNQYGSIRIPQSYKGAKEYHQNHPEDVETYDLNEKPHERSSSFPEEPTFIFRKRTDLVS